MCLMPSTDSASTMALTPADSEPTVPTAGGFYPSVKPWHNRHNCGPPQYQISPDALILHQNCSFFLPYPKVVHDAVKGSGSSDTQ